MLSPKVKKNTQSRPFQEDCFHSTVVVDAAVVAVALDDTSHGKIEIEQEVTPPIYDPVND